MTVMGILYDPPSIILCNLHVNMYSKGCKVQPGFSLVPSESENQFEFG